MKKNSLLAPGQTGTCALLAPVEGIAHGVVSQAVLTTPGLRLTLFHFAAGQGLSEHTSTARALVQLLSGSCTFTAGGRNFSLKPGDLLHLPPGEPHAVAGTEPFSMLLTQVTEPAA